MDATSHCHPLSSQCNLLSPVAFQPHSCDIKGLVNVVKCPTAIPAECTGSRLITEVKQALGWVSTWMGDRLGIPSAVGLFPFLGTLPMSLLSFIYGYKHGYY